MKQSYGNESPQMRPRVRPPERGRCRQKPDNGDETSGGVKSLWIIIILLVIAGVCIAGYYYFLRDNAATVVPEDRSSEEIVMVESEESISDNSYEEDAIVNQMETTVADNDFNALVKIFEGDVIIHGERYPIRLTINLNDGKIVLVEYENINYGTCVTMDFPESYDPMESAVVLTCDNPEFEIHLPSECVWGDQPIRMGRFVAENGGENVSYPIEFYHIN